MNLSKNSHRNLCQTWRSNTINFRMKIELYKSQIVSSFAEGCELYTGATCRLMRLRTCDTKACSDTCVEDVRQPAETREC